MQPRYLTGDLVIKEPIVAGPKGVWLGKRGMVIGVNKSNPTNNHLADIYPFVYYVFFHDGTFEGPLFQSQLHDA